MLKKAALISAMLLALSPAAARADWLFTPNVGATFGGDASGNSQFTYGATLGWMGAGIFGWEADLSYTPDFFDTSGFSFEPAGSNNVVSWMANVVAGVPIGGQHGGGFRPYVTAGVGVLQTRVGSSSDLFHVNNDEFGFNAGVGAIGFVSDHVGIKGDVRYVRSFQDPVADNEFDIAAGNFDFWRGTLGVTFRW